MHLPAVLQQSCQAHTAEPDAFHSTFGAFVIPFEDCHYICAVLHVYHSVNALSELGEQSVLKPLQSVHSIHVHV